MYIRVWKNINVPIKPSSQTMGLSPKAFSMMKERIDENHPWVITDDKIELSWYTCAFQTYCLTLQNDTEWCTYYMSRHWNWHDCMIRFKSYNSGFLNTITLHSYRHFMPDHFLHILQYTSNQIKCSWNPLCLVWVNYTFNIALKKGWQEAIFITVFIPPIDKRGHIVLHLLVGGL